MQNPYDASSSSVTSAVNLGGLRSQEAWSGIIRRDESYSGEIELLRPIFAGHFLKLISIADPVREYRPNKHFVGSTY